MALGADTVTQSLVLRPGWNSIFLEVEPTNSAVASVFSGINVESVWTHHPKLGSTEWTADPSEPVWNKSKWLVHLPATNAAAFNNTLFQVLGSRGYLVKAGGAVNQTLSVTGRPVHRRVGWVPNAFNFRGFSVDTNVPVSFGTWFAGSAAHYDGITLQKTYRMDTAGQWQAVSAGTFIESGVAYWVYCNGESSYGGPLDMILDGGATALDFGTEAAMLPVQFINRTGSARNAILTDLSPMFPVAEPSLNATNGVVYADLGAVRTNALTANGSTELRLVVRRDRLSTTTSNGLFRITDGRGVRYWLPASAERNSTNGGNTAQSEAISHAGLWVGTISVTHVAHAHGGTITNVPYTNLAGVVSYRPERVGSSTAPLPTASPFQLRVLLHVDGTGTTRLLREVTQMFKAPTTTNDAAGLAQVSEAARYVLLTEASLFPSFQGARLHDNSLVGRRLSSAGFDFPVVTGSNHLAMTGWFAKGEELAGTITLGPDFATHPFRHKYHPDHDNLDASFTSFKQEAPTITRSFVFEFDVVADAAKVPNFGYDRLTGLYTETLSGLHRTNLYTRGTVDLRRVSTIASLNE